MWAIARVLVATAAGAGLGAGAALARRHLLGIAPDLDAGAEPVVEAAVVSSQHDASAPTAPASGPDVAPVAANPAEVADLDAARARLRQRAAELRAEMEGRG